MDAAFITAIPIIVSRSSAFTSTPSRRQQPICPTPCHARLASAHASWRMTAIAPSSPADIDAAAEEPDWPSAQDMSKSATPATVLSVEDIMRILPHRHPFLLLDRVIAYEPGKRAIGVKAVTVSEPFFPGHFPERPIMPGVLQVEALAQLGGIVMLQPPFVDGDAKDVEFFFGGVDRVKWRRPVVPGDTLIMEMNLVSFKKSFGIAKMEGKAYVAGKLAVEGRFTLVMVRDKK